MRDIFYLELAKKTEEIHQKEKHLTEEEKRENNLLLLDAIDQIVYLSNVGRKEGLLALEESVYQMDEYKDNIKKMVLYICDAYAPELIEEMTLMRYMVKAPKDYEGLKMLLQLNGVLSVQMGENPRVIEEKLLSMVPDGVIEIYRERNAANIKSLYELKLDEKYMGKLEKLYHGELNVKIAEIGFPEVFELDYLIKHLADRSLQRGLREIDNADLELALKGLSGEARKRVFDNMSKRLSIMIVEDMEDMGNYRTVRIGEAIKKILHMFIRLIDRYDINCEESDEIFEFYQKYKSKL